MSKRNCIVPYEDVMESIYRENPALGFETLNQCLKDGYIDEALIVLQRIIRMNGGVPAVAKSGGLHEKTLYKSLAADGNPTLKTLFAVASTMGMRLAFLPKDVDSCKSSEKIDEVTTV